MRIRKLNAKGIAHYIAPLIVVVVFGVAGVGYLVASHAATCSDVEFRIGATGQCVKNLQILANHKLPYIPSYPSPTIATDGNYTSDTQAGILRIQKAWGLANQNGIVGPTTWKALCSEGTISSKAGGEFTAAEKTAAENSGCAPSTGKIYTVALCSVSGMPATVGIGKTIQVDPVFTLTNNSKSSITITGSKGFGFGHGGGEDAIDPAITLQPGQTKTYDPWAPGFSITGRAGNTYTAYLASPQLGTCQAVTKVI